MRRVNLFNTVALLMMGAMFTSCMSDDAEEAMYLSGQWTGNFGMFYNYEYRGEIYQFNSYDTDIVFYPDYQYATRGYGEQVDYYYEGPYEKMCLRFYWEINRGVIYLDYPRYPEYTTQIRDYSLTDASFRGYFVNGTNEFRLRKIAGYYDWGYYESYGDYYYWNNPNWSWGGYYYYGKTRGIDADGDAENDVEKGKIVGLGNRFTNK